MLRFLKYGLGILTDNVAQLVKSVGRGLYSNHPDRIWLAGKNGYVI